MNVTNELIFETLKAMQADIATLKADMHDVKRTLVGMEAHLSAHQLQIAGLMQHDGAQDSAMNALRSRVDRIERRLELTEN